MMTAGRHTSSVSNRWWLTKVSPVRGETVDRSMYCSVHRTNRYMIKHNVRGCLYLTNKRMVFCPFIFSFWVFKRQPWAYQWNSISSGEVVPLPTIRLGALFPFPAALIISGNDVILIADPPKTIEILVAYVERRIHHMASVPNTNSESPTSPDAILQQYRNIIALVISGLLWVILFSVLNFGLAMITPSPMLSIKHGMASFLLECAFVVFGEQRSKLVTTSQQVLVKRYLITYHFRLSSLVGVTTQIRVFGVITFVFVYLEFNDDLRMKIKSLSSIVYNPSRRQVNIQKSYAYRVANEISHIIDT